MCVPGKSEIAEFPGYPVPRGIWGGGRAVWRGCAPGGSLIPGFFGGQAPGGNLSWREGSRRPWARGSPNFPGLLGAWLRRESGRRGRGGFLNYGVCWCHGTKGNPGRGWALVRPDAGGSDMDRGEFEAVGSGKPSISGISGSTAPGEIWVAGGLGGFLNCGVFR
jgi:hypothetical protein